MVTCNICDCELDYSFDNNLAFEEIQSFRESLFCKKCNSISRDRLMMWALSNCISKKERLSDLSTNKEIRILESTGVRGHPNTLESKFDYFNTIFDPEAIHQNKDPRKYADFQELHFEDKFFDYVLASDVFEHVRLDDKAYSEIYRTLKKDGYFIMTVPFSYDMKETLVRVKTDGERDIFVLPPEYHAENTLVYRTYGKDIFKKLNSHGFNVCYLRVQIPSYAISQQEVFLCRKGSVPDIDLQMNDIIIWKKDEFPIASNDKT